MQTAVPAARFTVPDIRKRRVVSPALFGLVLLAIFVPFASVTWQGQSLGSFPIVDLIKGDSSTDQSAEREPRAMFLVLAAGVGLAFGLIKGARQHLLSLIAAGAGLAALASLRLRIDADVRAFSDGQVKVRYDLGFYAVLILLLLVVVLNGYAMSRSRAGGSAPARPPLAR